MEGDGEGRGVAEGGEGRSGERRRGQRERRGRGEKGMERRGEEGMEERGEEGMEERGGEEGEEGGRERGKRKEGKEGERRGGGEDGLLLVLHMQSQALIMTDRETSKLTKTMRWLSHYWSDFHHFNYMHALKGRGLSPC